MTYDLSCLAMNTGNAGAQNTKQDAMKCSHAISRVAAMFIPTFQTYEHRRQTADCASTLHYLRS